MVHVWHMLLGIVAEAQAASDEIADLVGRREMI
jgi:hypothetical protein